MSKHFDYDDQIKMDSWTRYYYNIENETTDSYLIRNGFLADTPTGFVKRMNSALAWMLPQVTPHTRSIFDLIKATTDEYERVTSPVQPFVQVGQVYLPRSPTDADTALRTKAEILFTQAIEMLKFQPALAAQEKYKQEQSDRASKPRKLTADNYRRIAKQYWDRKSEGRGYGAVKELAATYNVSQTTIQSIVKKSKPK